MSEKEKAREFWINWMNPYEWCKALEAAEKRVKELEFALEFYADESNYGSDDVSRHDGFQCFDIVLYDFSPSDTKACKRVAGHRARQVLKRGGEK